VRAHAAAVSFLEALEVPTDFRQDIETVRAIVHFQSGDRDFAQLYGQWFDPIYTYMTVTLDRGSDVEARVSAVLSEALRQLPDVSPGPAQLRPWLFSIAYDSARALPLGELGRTSENGHGHRSADAADVGADAEESGGLDWLSDDELVLLIERRPRPERHVLVLRYFAGLGFAEIGDVMAIGATDAVALHKAAVDSLDATLTTVSRAPRLENRHPMGRLIHQTPVLHRRRRALLAV
jgi:DNA-directed RNA polymerase specialized sigma24 family protein